MISLISSNNICAVAEETLASAVSADLMPTFIIVPDRFTLQAERILLSKKSCLFGVRVVTFSMLFNILHEEIGIGTNVLDKTSAVLFMWRAIQQVKKDLVWFNRSVGHYAFAEKMFNTINQLSSSLVDFDKLEKSASADVTRKKMHDIVLIRGAYKKLIAERTDSSGMLGWLIENIKHSKIIKNAKVFITGFQHLSIQRNAVMAQLMQHAKQFVAGYQKGTEFEEFIAENCMNFGIDASQKTFNKKSTCKSELRKFDTNQDEAAWIVNEICRLTKTEGVRFRDIVVLAEDSAVLAHVFAQNGIAANIDIGDDLLQASLTQYLKEYLLLAATGGQMHFLNIIKNVNSGLCAQEEFDIENNSLKSGVRGNETTAVFVKKLGKCKTVKDFCRELAIIAEVGQDDIVRRRLLELLETVGTVSSDQKVAISEFINMFVALATATKVSDVPTSSDAVMIAAAAEYQPSFAPYVFIVGANDGVFPTQQEDTDIITMTDIASLNVRVEPSASMQNSRNRRHALDIMSSATKKLYVSYVGQNPSELVESIPVVNLESQIASKTFASNIVLKAIGDGTAFEDMQYYGEVLKSLDLGDMQYTDLSQSFTDLKTGGQLFILADRLSVTQLENFRKCPYYHFLENGLRVRARERNKIATNIMGTIIHKLAEEFTRAIIDVGREGFESFNAEGQMKSVLESVLYIEGFRFMTTDPRNAPIIANLKKEALVMARDIVEQIKQSKYFPTHVEMSMQGEIDSVTVRGQADRIDTTTESHAIIIDYKTGSIDKQSLQLPLYMKFLPDSYAADNAYYFSLRPGSLKEHEVKQMDAEHIASEIITKIKKGVIIPNPKDNSVCRYCVASGMCNGGVDGKD